MCELGRLEFGNRSVQLVTLPGCLVHHRFFEADTPEGLDEAINAFEAKLVAAGGLIYQVSCMSDTRLLYVVTYYHKAELEIFI